jgi:hypothetical protein
VYRKSVLPAGSRLFAPPSLANIVFLPFLPPAPALFQEFRGGLRWVLPGSCSGLVRF